MHKLIRLAVVLAVIALLVATAAPALADKPEKTTLVAPSIGGPDDSVVTAPVAMVPDKSTNPSPIHDSNPAYGGPYPGKSAPGTPGIVFWSLNSNGG